MEQLFLFTLPDMLIVVRYLISRFGFLCVVGCESFIKDHTLKARAAELQAELGQAQEAAVNVEKFMAVVRKYTSFEELTPTLLREFVEKIVVHECWKDEQGTRHQDIEIYYSFVGKVDLPDD